MRTPLTLLHLRHRRSVLLIMFLATILPVPACVSQESSRSRPASPGLHPFSLRVKGMERDCIVHVPRGYDPGNPCPVVIMFHGGGGTAQGAMRETGWDRKADEEGFLVVFPEGTREDPDAPARFVGNGQTWNDGSDRGNLGAVVRKVDDVEFIRRLIIAMRKRFAVDTRRICLTGFSNGASMAFRAGRELAHLVAAIAPVAGSDWSTGERIDHPVPLLYITGTADPLNPMNGGEISIGRKTMGVKPPVKEMIDRWVRMLGCPSESPALEDSNGVWTCSYQSCGGGAEVVLCTVDGMGHVWPGGRNLLPERLVGKETDKLVATDVIWEFFARHARK